MNITFYESPCKFQQVTKILIFTKPGLPYYAVMPMVYENLLVCLLYNIWVQIYI